MDNQEDKSKCLRDTVALGTSPIDVVEATEDLILDQAIRYRSDLREAGLELFAEKAFYKAAKKLVELMDSEDEDIQIRAAAKLVDIRRDTYKAKKAEKTIEHITDKLFDDGFDFVPKKRK